MTQKRVLITGGAGFIGSNMAAYQLQKGNQVWVVDNLSTGKLENIAPFKKNSDFRFNQADLRDWPQLGEAVEWADLIFHIAGSVGQKLILKKPVTVLNNNIHGCEAILKAMAAKRSTARILVVSTSEVYVHSKEDPDGRVRETAVLSMVASNYLQETYPVSKLVNELLALSYMHETGLDCTIARIFNTIGVNQSSAYGMVVPSFIEQALAGKPITIYGDGLQTRSFSDVRDTITALDLLLSVPGSKGEVVNVGDDRECSIIDLAKLIKKKTNSQSKISYLSYKEAYGVDFVDVRRRQPNLEKLRRLTGFSPKWSLNDSIDSILETVKQPA